MEKYDVIIVGAGPMGMMSAYELLKARPTSKVLLIDKGLDIHKRQCPILQGKIKKCPTNAEGVIGCSPACSITSGFGGSGAYSDGKFNITSEFGGWLDEYLDDEEILELIHYMDEINLEHGAPKNITDPYSPKVEEIERRGIAYGLKLLRAEVCHFGTEVNLQVLKNINLEMKKHVEMRFETEVEDILVEDKTVVGVLLTTGEKIYSKYVVLGVGRNGSEWSEKILTKHGVIHHHNSVDIGVRVETNDIVMAEINEHLYEGKFVYKTSLGTKVRTFCANPSGHVVIENHNGVAVCNGHSFNDPELGSNNTNFALLVSHRFEEPFKNPNAYAIEIARLANQLSNGSVIVQSYGDIKKKRRSTVKRINEGFVKPTLKDAVPGDLGLVLPFNTMQAIIEMIEALDSVTPGIANDHTLFYGVEAKFYSARPAVRGGFELRDLNNIFVGGDGAGLTRGLAQSSANGIYIARYIAEKLNGER